MALWKFKPEAKAYVFGLIKDICSGYDFSNKTLVAFLINRYGDKDCSQLKQLKKLQLYGIDNYDKLIEDRQSYREWSRKNIVSSSKYSLQNIPLPLPINLITKVINDCEKNDTKQVNYQEEKFFKICRFLDLNENFVGKKVVANKRKKIYFKQKNLENTAFIKYQLKKWLEQKDAESYASARQFFITIEQQKFKTISLVENKIPEVMPELVMLWHLTWSGYRKKIYGVFERIINRYKKGDKKEYAYKNIKLEDIIFKQASWDFARGETDKAIDKINEICFYSEKQKLPYFLLSKQFYLTIKYSEYIKEGYIHEELIEIYRLIKNSNLNNKQQAHLYHNLAIREGLKGNIKKAFDLLDRELDLLKKLKKGHSKSRLLGFNSYEKGNLLLLLREYYPQKSEYLLQAEAEYSLAKLYFDEIPNSINLFYKNTVNIQLAKITARNNRIKAIKDLYIIQSSFVDVNHWRKIYGCKQAKLHIQNDIY